MTTLSHSTTQENAAPRARIYLVGVVILGAALFRLVPHPQNFTPIGAMALFGGAAIANRRLAFLFPLSAMFISDLFIGFGMSRLWVYGSIVLITMLGRTLQKRRRRPEWIAAGSLAASVLFFVITNFGVWLSSGWYTHTIGELVRCYTLAIPFFGNTVSGDLVFSAALFGGLAFVESRATSPAGATVGETP